VKTVAVIPAKDAAGTIGDVVRGLRAAVPGIEVLVVDDGSADATGARAREAGADVRRHEVNRGKGAALQTGFDGDRARIGHVAADVDAGFGSDQREQVGDRRRGG
jgi:glycosyltransferase involved in cell wall biosynthesis